ncbi:MAG: SDR family NAD(P)-dependent oxidoreductase [Candidatus Aminicenantes bacterium]|nr:SDR family NAD(P)-dependent oxidoreductase [Candidatus Aminicenantes bacterium]
MNNKVFITGASGLLGRSLVEKFTNGGWFVFAHYNRNKGAGSDICEWLPGDFSTIEKTRNFLDCNKDKLKECTALINNYGPITYKSTADITSSDLISDLHGNLIVPNEITSYLLKSGNLHSVVNIGFEGVGEIRPYKKILPYAIAKAGLRLLTLSNESEFPDINFSMVSPSSLTGGEYGKVSGEYTEPDSIAEEIFKIVCSGDHNV